MLIRPLRNVCNHIYGIRITTEPVKILGIDLGHIKEQCLEKNWQDKIDNMSKMLDSRGKRKLTRFGKREIIDTMLSQNYNIISLFSPTLLMELFSK